jgi:hypothetical protein
MAKQTINIGAAPNDGTGTPLRTSFDYCNQNFTELYTATGPSGNNIVVPGTATIAGDLTVDTNTLFVNSTTNRVGINTASPTDSLHVYGSGNALIEGTAGLYARTNYKVGAKTWQVGYRSGTTQFEIQEDLVERYTIGNGGTPHTWYIGASTAMTLNSTGLGVGVTPSAWAAGFKSAQVGSRLVLTTTGSDTFFGNNFYNDGAYKFINADYATYYDQTTGKHIWGTSTTSGAVNGVITWNPAMTLDASGNLLVGTASTGGSASNSVKNVGGVFSTVNGATGSIATGVAATLFTAPSEAVFIVSAYIVGSASPANYNAVAIVRVSGGTAAITTISTASNLTISLSGLNVQATQTSGINQAFAYSAIRIS